jgi:AmmeMemoRadiSam system protein A
MLTPEEQDRLLKLARRALEARVCGQPVAPPHDPLDLACGAFVSIHRRGELRGCLGRLDASWPLPQVVAHLAEAVADSDPRFEPVERHELAELDIEISVLTPGYEIESPDAIEVGRHGLIVEDSVHRGLLLPQVAIERGWDRIRFLEHTCLKAGLTADAWQRGARVFVFEAQVFGDHST